MRQLTFWSNEAETDAVHQGRVFFQRSQKSRDYDAFVEKFQTRKTTDDCYTPDNVYDAIAAWVEGEYGASRDCFVRPFYPGGDYERYEYPAGSVVVDNPPFSILAAIVKFYVGNGIKFFMFAPALTLFSPVTVSHCCSIGVGVQITYENGAEVPTSFVTNLEEAGIRTAPTLYQAVEVENEKNLKQNRKKLPNTSIPSTS